MDRFLPTIILRHRKENLKKCSLRGLESREDMQFFTYPKDPLPSLQGYFLLALDAPILSEADRNMGIFLIDGTWKYAAVMGRQVPPIERRSLPSGLKTSYPRKQTGCSNPEEGLASIEALYAAYCLTGRDPTGILDRYYWKDQFLEANPFLLF